MADITGEVINDGKVQEKGQIDAQDAGAMDLDAVSSNMEANQEQEKKNIKDLDQEG